MPVIGAARLTILIEQAYDQEEEKIRVPIMRWLQETGAKKHIEGYLNQVIIKFAKKATEQAALNRSLRVVFSLNVAKIAQKFWGNLAPQLQASVTQKQMCLVMEYLLEEQDLVVKDHTMLWEQQIPAYEDEEEEVPGDGELDIAEEEVVAALPSSPPALSPPPVEEGLIPGQPVPQPPTPAPAPSALDEALTGDDDSPEDSADNNGASEPPVQVGSIFAKGSVHRRVDSIDDDDGKLAYTVVASENRRVKPGSTGSISHKGMMSWATEQVA